MASRNYRSVLALKPINYINYSILCVLYTKIIIRVRRTSNLISVNLQILLRGRRHAAVTGYRKNFKDNYGETARRLRSKNKTFFKNVKKKFQLQFDFRTENT